MKLIYNIAPFIWVFFALSCGGGDSSGSGNGGVSGKSGSGGMADSGAGSGGATGGSGGASTGGAGGTGGSGGTGVTGGTGGTGGSGGSAITDASADASPFDASSVDLTLGGFNQDLPAPSVNCMERNNISIGCISVSGIVDGESFDLSCGEGNTTTGSAATSTSINCTTDYSDWSVSVIVPFLGQQSFTVDRVFLPGDSRISGVTFIWKNKWVFTDSPNFVKSQIAGWSELVNDAPMSWQERELKGVFAATWSKPDPNNCAVSQEEGCIEVRLRGTFHAFE